jgi:NADPH-dependent ferric siderophore reductase
MTAPLIERVRHELVRRRVTVARSERLTPHMQRITLVGPELAGFASFGFDDHVKIILGEVRRDYTPRRFDAAKGELAVDFALHEAGPITGWAMAAKPGDEIDIGGPRGSQIIGGPVGRWLLIGDETALPAIGRKAEGAREPVTTLVAVPGPADVQILPGARQHWVFRDQTRAADPATLLAAAEAMTLTPDTFVWIAAEARVARALKCLFLDERGHAPQWIKASGYWIQGEADASAKDL